MKSKSKIFKYIKNINIFLIFIFFLTNSLVIANSHENKKSIIFILDQISTADLENSNTPNIDKLINSGGSGLINIRAKSNLANKGSSYLSLGSGVRTLASTQGKLAFNRDYKHNILNLDKSLEDPDNLISTSDLYELYTNSKSPDGEILNIAIEDIKRTASNVTPNNTIGTLGQVAKENDLIIGVLGNNDSNNYSREFTMIAMDEEGSIPYGNVSNDLLIQDRNILGNLKLDSDKFMNEFERIHAKVDILFINFGDVVRVQQSKRLASDDIQEKQKIKAIEETDRLIGEILSKTNAEKTMFTLLVPNPSNAMAKKGNFGLTPIIVSKPSADKSILSSNTTRRHGLITNFDFAPTILSFFGVDTSKDFVGEPVNFIKNPSPIEVIKNIEHQSLYLRRFRKVFHWIFIALIILVLLLIYKPLFVKKRLTNFNFQVNNLVLNLALTLLTIPLTMITVPLLGYKNIVIDLIYVFLGAFVLSQIIFKICRSKLLTTGFISLITSSIILLDAFYLKKLMIISPLGSDAIAGGRFYGIGNDYMGILLGATIFGMFSLFERYQPSNLKTLTVTSLGMIAVVIGLSPLFGANMGGTLAATGTFLIAILIILDKKISFKKLFILGLVVIIFILFIATIDSLFNPNPTHAGKALLAIKGGNWSKLIEIISIKLRQVFWNLFNASWNIVLFSHIIISLLLYKFKRTSLKNVEHKNNYQYKSFKIILLSSLLIFLFNDTGTIAAGIILSYALIPIGFYIKEVSA